MARLRRTYNTDFEREAANLVLKEGYSVGEAAIQNHRRIFFQHGLERIVHHFSRHPDKVVVIFPNTSARLTKSKTSSTLFSFPMVLSQE